MTVQVDLLVDFEQFTNVVIHPSVFASQR